MTPSRKTLAVLIPTYNGEKYLAASLDSVLAQSRQPDEILVCNDASTDSTQKILEEYSRKFPGLIRYITNEKNLGLAANRQRLLESTQCDLVKFLDDDDLLHPRFLEWVTPLVESGEYDLAAASVLNFHNDDISQIDGDFPVRLRGWKEPAWAHHFAVAGHVINKVHNRKFLLDAGGFTDLTGPGEDFALDLRLALHGARLGVVAAHLVYHRARPRPRTFTNHQLMINAFHFLRDAVLQLEKRGWFQGHDKERKILADRLWHMGRLLSDAGDFDIAMEAFACSRQLLNQGIVHGSLPYKILAACLGLRTAEKLRTARQRKS